MAMSNPEFDKLLGNTLVAAIERVLRSRHGSQQDLQQLSLSVEMLFGSVIGSQFATSRLSY